MLKEHHAKVVHFLISCIAYMVIKSCSDVIQVAQQSEQTFLLFVVPHLFKKNNDYFLFSVLKKMLIVICKKTNFDIDPVSQI